MAYYKDAVEYAESQLISRRQRCFKNDENRRKQIRDTVNGFSELYDERLHTGTRRIKAKLTRDNALYRELTLKQEEITKALSSMLSEYGYALSDLEDTHECQLCSDTGLLPDGRMCSCKRALICEYVLSELNSSSPLALSTFDTFSLDYYSDKPENGQTYSPRDMMTSTLKKCRRFVAEFPQSGNLLMTGPSGLGKTHLALAIADELLKKGRFVIYCSAAGTLRTICDELTDFSKESVTLDSLKQCELLVLDDLGSEYNSDLVLSVIYDVINSRLNAGRPTVITTNFSDWGMLSARYTEKIVSRLSGCYKLLPFCGEDIRIQKKKKTLPGKK